MACGAELACASTEVAAEVRICCWVIFVTWVASILVNVGMWCERFNIVITSLHRDFLPSSWGMYYPTFWDWATLFGSFGVFLTFFFLFIRFIPMISIAEMRMLLDEERKEAAA